MADQVSPRTFKWNFRSLTHLEEGKTRMAASYSSVRVISKICSRPRTDCQERQSPDIRR